MPSSPAFVEADGVDLSVALLSSGFVGVASEGLGGTGFDANESVSDVVDADGLTSERFASDNTSEDIAVELPPLAGSVS